MCNKWLAIAILVCLAVVLTTLAGCGGNAAGISDMNGAQASVAKTVHTTDFPVNDDGTEPCLIGYKHGKGHANGNNIITHHGRSKQKFDDLDIEAADLSADGIQALRDDPDVDYVEPDSVVSISGVTAKGAAVVVTPTDTVPTSVTAVKAPLCWSKYTGSAVKVAVLDTGVDTANTDLSPNYKGGYNFIANTATPTDDNGHGTEVAGTLCAAANGTVLEGVAPKVSLYALKVLDVNGNGNISAIIAALQWCVTNKMQVVNMSFGQSAASASLASACSAAANANCLLVAAAGNLGVAPTASGNVQYPAACTGVMAIGAVDANNALASFSCTGPQIALVAPGVNIVTDKKAGGTITISGTSFACPAVAGAAALLISSGVTAPATVRTKLQSTATHLGTTGVNALYGNGLVNCGKACSIPGA